MQQIALLLPNIRSTFNVGSIFRSAEIFGINEIIISGYTPYPELKNDPRIPHLSQKINRQISKTALGTEKLVPFRYFPDTNDGIVYLKKSGYELVALEQNEQSIPLTEYFPKTKTAIIIGEEVSGIDNELLNQCSKIVEIPQIGTKESLNVANAVAILLYDICIGKQK